MLVKELIACIQTLDELRAAQLLECAELDAELQDRQQELRRARSNHLHATVPPQLMRDMDDAIKCQQRALGFLDGLQRASAVLTDRMVPAIKAMQEESARRGFDE